MDKIMIHNDELGVERAITPGGARSALGSGWELGPIAGEAVVDDPAGEPREVIEIAPDLVAPVVTDHGPTTAGLRAANPRRGTTTDQPVDTSTSPEEGTS